MSQYLAAILLSPEALLVVATLLALAASDAFFFSLGRFGRRPMGPLAIALKRRCRWPARFTVPALTANLMLPGVHSPAINSGVVPHLFELLLMASGAWLIVAMTFAAEDVAIVRYRVDVSDNLKARRARTRINVIRRLTVVAVSILTFAVMLTTFTGVQVFGTSLLASAGIASIVVGVAARPTIANLIAGLQIFFAEPIRIDDVVVVEGQWGRIEEITLNYVVVRIWDDRRLLIPIAYFLERPFENWTRRSASLLAAVHISVDHMIAVATLREELRDILAASPLWDGRFWNLQVTEVDAEAAQLRALMTARDATTAWDLRCEVREKLLVFLQREHPASLPHRRVRITNSGDA